MSDELGTDIGEFHLRYAGHRRWLDLDEVAQVILLLLAECETHDHDMDYQTDDRVIGRALEIVRKLKGGA